ncbi:hypothetical protein C0Q70_00716 [Pomacea canaliculata]|uniref:J domain-containing protein n=1 Tax=Pomacea canaliculata TaxID=400727 RepID=A0A2T7PXF3_POMCA|nr:hypothetical protein C0Q70_00716 [Pomacea canaliculata]
MLSDGKATSWRLLATCMRAIHRHCLRAFNHAVAKDHFLNNGKLNNSLHFVVFSGNIWCSPLLPPAGSPSLRVVEYSRRLFCVGWVRDLWRLPEYVKECNEDQNVDVRDRNDNSFTVRSRGKPKVGFARFFGMMMMGIILGYLVQAACPKEVFNSPGIVGWICSMVIPPFAAAIGVHLVANIGLLQASLKWPLIGAYLGSLWLLEDPNNIGMAHGWRNVLNELLKDLDPQGEANAYKVLGLDDSATQEDIKAQYRKLVKRVAS